MSAITRLLSSLCVLLITASCAGSISSGNPSATTAGTAMHESEQELTSATNPRMRNNLTDSMLTQIVDYYRKKYGSDSLKMSILSSDTVVEVSFQDTSGGLKAFQSILLVAYISLATDTNPILEGDVNGDGKNDMLVSVHTEGGGGGGNAYWDDHFLFLTEQNGRNRLADVKSDGELMDGSGYFFPKEIIGRTIIGIGNAYTENDGHCCPSLYYKMKVQFIDGQLKTVDKAATAKPTELE